MTKEQKLALLEEVFEMETGTLKADTDLKDLEEWDSLTRLSVIVMMEDRFGKKIDGSVIKGFHKVSDILTVME